MGASGWQYVTAYTGDLDACLAALHDAEFQLQDLGKQLKPIIESFYAAEQLRTCKKCGHVMSLPGSAPAPK